MKKRVAFLYGQYSIRGSTQPRITNHLGNQARFSFEQSWLTKDGFYELIAAQRRKFTRGANAMDRWQNRIRYLRQFLWGWAKNLRGEFKAERDRLLRKVEELDVLAEQGPLSCSDWEAKRLADDQLAGLYRDEETKWSQRAKVNSVRNGDNNTRYFHLVANGKHRKKRIFRLEQEEDTIVGDAQLKLYITSYYKQLFGPSELSYVSMDEMFFQIRHAVFQMEHNKANGPDGFPVEFFQRFWEVIKEDLMALFDGFHADLLPIYTINFGIITLLPKKEDASQIQQFRPICFA